MNAALLGVTHPHSGALLSSLENEPGVGRISVWDDRPPGQGAPELPHSRKVTVVTTDLDRVLAEPSIAFAIVAARHDRAADLAQRVLDSGKHLLAEKPVALRATEIERLDRRARQAGLVAGVLYTRRMSPAAQEARRLIAAGGIGPLLSLEARFLATQVRFRNPRSWLFKRDQAGGGILMWLGCHYLDLLQDISGESIISVGARLATRSGEHIDVEDTAVLTLEFSSGALGTFHAGYSLAHAGHGYLNASGYDASLAFNGRDGRVVWPTVAPRLRVETPASGDLRPVRDLKFREPATSSYAGASGAAFLRAFIEAIHRGHEPPAPLAAAARTARIIEAVERSNRLGRRIPVQPEPPAKEAGSEKPKRRAA